jgi:anti-anti-sigma factor
MTSRDNPQAVSTTTVLAGPGRLSLLVVGELDIAAKDHVLRAAIDALDVPGINELVIDLSRTSFMDASGAYALHRAQVAWSSNGRTVSVTAARGAVGEVLYLTGVADALGLPLRLGPRPHERREPLTASGGAEKDDRAPGQDPARHRE